MIWRRYLLFGYLEFTSLAPRNTAFMGSKGLEAFSVAYTSRATKKSATVYISGKPSGHGSSSFGKGVVKKFT